jgi:nucleotide-binding universal stress UspA family protein
MYQKVLVGYDGSKEAHDALALAQRLVEKKTGKLTLVCTYLYTVYQPHIDGGTYVEALHEHAEETLREGRAVVADGIEVETIAVAAASAAQGLSFIAEDKHFDLLVLGSTHHSPVGRILLGSTGERLMHAAPCAVAVAPKDLTETEPFKHIGVAFDGSRESTAALEAACKLALDTKAKLSTYTVESLAYIPSMPGAELAYAAKDDLAHERAKETVGLAQKLIPKELESKTWILKGDPQHSIIEKATESKIDLLMVGSRAYGAVKRAFLGSVSTGLLRHTPFPIVILPRLHAEEGDSADQGSNSKAAVGSTKKSGRD